MVGKSIIRGQLSSALQACHQFRVSSRRSPFSFSGLELLPSSSAETVFLKREAVVKSHLATWAHHWWANKQWDLPGSEVAGGRAVPIILP